MTSPLLVQRYLSRKQVRMRRNCDVKIPPKPCDPYPIVTSYVDVVAGFGRGSSELGIPTANVPIEQLPHIIQDLEVGVYFGWCHLKSVPEEKQRSELRPDGRQVHYNNGSRLLEGDLKILPVVLSLGWNPFYQNTKKTVELHILHNFESDFYGAKIKFSFLGYIRPELNYTTKEALIADIRRDIEIAQETLNTHEYEAFRHVL